MMGTRDHVLITGGAGFVGSNLADTLLRDGQRVIVADNFARAGVRRNAAWLQANHGDRVRIEQVDVSDAARITPLVRQSRQVFHLAAQVAVTTSLEDPATDLQTNVIGTFNVLEAARTMPNPPTILFTSTNKVYGGMDDVKVELAGDAYRYADGRAGVTEATPLDFHSPYGCSKGAADQYVHDYARIYGLPTIVFRMSCIYGTRQFGTEDQGWVAHFGRALYGREPITVYGDGCQVRDVLWIDDLVEAMRLAVGKIHSVSGQVFNVGGGAANAVTVRGVIERLSEITGRTVPVHTADWRPGDQRIYVSDSAKMERVLGWKPRTSWKAGLEKLVGWLHEANLEMPVGMDEPMHEPVLAAGR
ncbi:SDR family NAD(P)-dependent oxidoreductase [Longimicrobium terrae]|uniref:CDP-paratose 2-epimerase n=1 Tax=Longimicrobium terrae TaxID=1639882 RepID=A0A841GUC4_9BACT|nr:SDR family NAD(P)-dependent oxidoreductase [Longimicrobium terrae]MBB4634567.1 CDP-paratose 2-epimerase [Longimicrobium terrae]MBB6068543.1 CDP-paratose 2-epimerase [Longimicrobium terrae]